MTLIRSLIECIQSAEGGAIRGIFRNIVIEAAAGAPAYEEVSWAKREQGGLRAEKVIAMGRAEPKCP
jgi:hypothetical protein